jgi:hypothetical protein
LGFIIIMFLEIGGETKMDTSQYGESAYITPELVKQSTAKKVYICGVAKIVQGKFGDKLELPVELDGKQKTWGLNRTVVQALQKFGEGKPNPKDDKHWVGKYVELRVINDGTKEIIVAIPVLTQTEAVQ